MKRRTENTSLRSLLLAVIVWTLAVVPSATGQTESEGPEQVVLAWNQAIGDRDFESALARFAPEAVQLRLKPAHAGLAADVGLTSDLEQRWRAIAPILLANTESYVRRLTDVVVAADGDLATVWASVHTETLSLGAEEVTELEFSETYTLFRIDGIWEIVAVANNRPTR